MTNTSASIVDRSLLALERMDRTLHDLSQPLTSMAMAMDLLACEKDEAAAQTMLLTAQKECARAMRDVIRLRNETATLLQLTKEKERGWA